MPVGIAMALLIGPLLEGWRPFWLANAGLAVVAAVLVVLLVRRDDQTTERLSWRGVGSDARATTMAGGPLLDRKSGVSGKSVSVSVDLGGRRIIKQTNQP